jgi:SAM-dependent methyltransferase
MIKIETPIKDFYNIVASEFDITRVRLWNCVKEYLDLFKSNSFILDIGCGNGKYFNYRKDIIIKGIDLSHELVKICQNKKLDVIEGNMLNLPFENNLFDGLLVVASYHHLNNDNDRLQALNEMYRVLKPNGLCFIEVWAMDQYENVNKNANFSNTDELVSWKTKNGDILYRYYHIYKENDLELEIKKLKPEFNIIKNGYEKGNYYIILQKNILN